MHSRRKVLVVGLGTIARTHHEVLTGDPAVEIIGGVDPHPTFSGLAPLFPGLDEAFDAGMDPDLVVVATPTDTHVDLVGDLLSRCDAMVLSEKPLAMSLSDVTDLERAHGAELVASRVKVAHHFAFSPEVEWARQVVARHPDWGPPSHILCVSNDAYAGLPPGQLAGYVSSWVDSGPNQLSVVAAFASGWRLLSHADRTDRAVTVLEHEGGRTTLSSNWLAGDTSKQTAVEFERAEVQLRIDHTSMTAHVIEGGEITTHLAYTGTAGRKAAHYLGLYRTLLTDPDDPRLSVGLAKAIATMLEAGADAVDPGHLTWSGTTETP